jgi:hypothetical protein
LSPPLVDTVGTGHGGRLRWCGGRIWPPHSGSSSTSWTTSAAALPLPPHADPVDGGATSLLPQPDLVVTCERRGGACFPVAVAGARRVTWMGSAGSSRVFLFYFINRGGHQTASEKVPLIVTFHSRRLAKTPRLMLFCPPPLIF